MWALTKKLANADKSSCRWRSRLVELSVRLEHAGALGGALGGRDEDEAPVVRL